MGRVIPPKTPQIASEAKRFTVGLACIYEKWLHPEILPCVSALGNGTGCKSIVGVYQGLSFNAPPDSSVCFIIPVSECTVAGNADSGLQNTRNPASASQTGSTAGLLKCGWTDLPQKWHLWLHCMSSKGSSPPHHCSCTSLLSGTVPLAILFSPVQTRSSAKLSPHLYTGQQTTLIYS